MRDYALLAKAFRHCGNGGICSDCLPYQRDHYCPDIHGRINAADAIEELLAVVNHLESCIDQALDALDRGADNDRARDALEKAQRFDPYCRNHGRCKWFEENRRFKFRDKHPANEEELNKNVE